jgi:hypothetical protein
MTIATPLLILVLLARPGEFARGDRALDCAGGKRSQYPRDLSAEVIQAAPQVA